MLIAQITDIHLGFEPDNPDELNAKRFRQVLAHVTGMTPKPDLLLLTGDLADKSDDREAYVRLRNILAECSIPTFFAMGNHDSRGPFLEVFADTPAPEGFVQYAIEGSELRILVLDTLEVGRHGGGFCEVRASWLRERLGERNAPTLIVLHHPPIAPGLSWMGESADAGWVKRLESIVASSPQVVGLIAGHLHRPVIASWGGTTLAVCASSAPQLPLDLELIDLERPDDRPMIVEAPPAYALHLWNGRYLVTHFGTVADPPVLATYTEAWQPLLRKLAAERDEL